MCAAACGVRMCEAGLVAERRYSSGSVGICFLSTVCLIESVLFGPDSGFQSACEK